MIAALRFTGRQQLRHGSGTPLPAVPLLEPRKRFADFRFEKDRSVLPVDECVVVADEEVRGADEAVDEEGKDDDDTGACSCGCSPVFAIAACFLCLQTLALFLTQF